MIKYSIIIPHKNIPNLLQRCLDSIPQRNDIQIIVVDDNSDSDIVNFEHFPGADRKNTEIYYDKTGKGAGHARNVGLTLAKGEWVLFADADDFFTPGISAVFNRCISDYDVIFYNAISLDSETYALSDRVCHLNRMVEIYNQSPSKGEFLLRYVFGEPWCKIIRRNLIELNHIHFEEVPIHNDTFFSYSVGLSLSTCFVDSTIGYVVTTRDNSLSQTISNQKLLTRVHVFAKKYAILKSSGIDLFESFIPETLVFLRAKNNQDLYAKCLEILGQYGITESFAERPNFYLEKCQDRMWMYKHAYEYKDCVSELGNIYSLYSKSHKLFRVLRKEAGILLKLTLLLKRQ